MSAEVALGLALLLIVLVVIICMVGDRLSQICDAEKARADRLAEQAQEQEETLRRERDIAEQERQKAHTALARIETQQAMYTQLTKISADEVATFAREAMSMQCRLGRGIVASVIICHEGVVIDWQAESDGAVAPAVIGECDGREIFKEYSFRGRHPDRFRPGRHRLSFAVLRGGLRAKYEDDLAFDIIVPEPPEPPEKPKPSPKTWEEDLRDKTTTFRSQAKAKALAKRQMEKELRKQTDNQDEIDVAMGMFEAMLNDESER